MAETETETVLAHDEPAPFPKWYDPEKHSPGHGGIVETATGTPLADDGLPAHPHLRAMREAEAAVPTDGGRRQSRAPHGNTDDNQE